MNILIVRAGALGDTLLTLPGIIALRGRYPGSRITVVGYAGTWEVARPLVDEIVSVENPRFAALLADSPSEQLRSYLRGFELAVRFSSVAGGDHVQTITPYPPPGVHAATWLVEAIGLPIPADLSGLLRLTQEEREEDRQRLASLRLERPVFIHPGAGAVWKRWPAERFARVAGELARTGHAVALIEGPADQEPVRAILAGGSYPVVREPSLRQLAAMLSWGKWYLGNDSGVTHLAALVGAPVVALFGPTDPSNWAPLGASVTVLRACLTGASHQGQIRVCDDPSCMVGIEVAEVAHVVNACSREL